MQLSPDTTVRSLKEESNQTEIAYCPNKALQPTLTRCAARVEVTLPGSSPSLDSLPPYQGG